MTTARVPTRRVGETLIPSVAIRDLRAAQIAKIYRVADARGVEFAEVWARATYCTNSGDVLTMLGGCAATAAQR